LVENHCFSQQTFLELKGSSKITSSSSSAAAAAVVTGSLNVIFFLSSKIKGIEKNVYSYQDPVLSNIVFLRYLIFDVKLECLLRMEKMN